ncbi:MAG: glycosyltransferase family 4 protein [Prevotella sp.]|nr:glycosyltransferase family 4 protein [Prevotella sp.]
MKVLHICSDYIGSKVHCGLYEKLDSLKLEQTIYTYFHNTNKIGRNRFESSHTTFYYRPVLKWYHRVLFHLKIRIVYRDIRNNLDIHSHNLTHATTLFSDGAVAYQIYKNFNIPYVVAVRSTDINAFLAYAPHTWCMGLKILKHAEKIIFISPALMENFCKHKLIRYVLPNIRDKFIVQLNGVDDYWLEHVQLTPRETNHNIIYVGRFDSNKNVVRLVCSVLKIKERYSDIKLHLVGGDGSQHKKIQELIQQNPDTLIYHGKVHDKNVLRHLYSQCSIFAMPSIHETFGLVYIEALSQNLKVLYSKGQGIDGLFNQQVGESVNPRSISNIRKALIRLLDTDQAYSSHEVVDFRQFNWDNIAKRYIDIVYSQTN